MLSGLHMKPVIKVDAGSLVDFWNAGVNAFRTNVTVAVETGMSGERLFHVYHAQEPLLRHLYFEATAFARRGWQAQHVFGRRDELTSAEEFAVSRFRTNVLNRERRAMNDYVGVIRIDGNFDRFATYAKTAYRLFPSVNTILGSIAERYSLDASRRKIVIRSTVEILEQFASPEIHLKARNAFDNLVELSVAQSEDGGEVSISGEHSAIIFKYRGRVGSLKRVYALLRNVWESEAALGWGIKVIESPRGETIVRVTIPEDNFASSGMVGSRKRTTQRLKPISADQHRDIIGMAKVFVGVQPYYGYRLVRGGMLDVRESPIYKSVVASQELIAPIVHSIVPPDTAKDISP